MKKIKEKKVESPCYTLTIDHDRDLVLTVLLACFHNNLDAIKFTVEKNIQSCVLELMEEISSKKHQQGWCEDPNCLEKNGG